MTEPIDKQRQFIAAQLTIAAMQNCYNKQAETPAKRADDTLQS